VAGCATGDQAYTIAIILNEFLEKDFWYEIYASDIDTEALEAAEKGLYESRNVRFVHHYYLNKYFDITKEGKFQTKEELKKNIKVFLFPWDPMLPFSLRVAFPLRLDQ